jgi:hypothetical protein
MLGGRRSFYHYLVRLLISIFVLYCPLERIIFHQMGTELGSFMGTDQSFFFFFFLQRVMNWYFFLFFSPFSNHRYLNTMRN